MKNIFLNLTKGLLAVSAVLSLNSCDDFLDRTPLSSVTPADYLKAEADLAAYTIQAYSFTTHSGWNNGIQVYDAHTDDVASDGSTWWWAPGERRTTETDGNYNFSVIRNCNYFFELVLPRYEAGEITGSAANIKHYIGEMYFLRAWNYFSKLKSYGDFPIITTVQTNERESLIESSQRRPRNEVARFILEDLDKAASMMQSSFKNQNRLTSRAALLVKSRVALYEASWLTYFKGTSMVPGGPGWPGASKDYNAGFTINIDSEIDFFLTQAMAAAKTVGDASTLVQATDVTTPTAADGHQGWNPYFDMFSSTDLGGLDEVIFWRDYDLDLNVMHGTSTFIRAGVANGMTRGLVDSYLMKNGLPIYAAGSGYQGDATLDNTKADRDVRLQLFMFSESDQLDRRYMDNIVMFGTEAPTVINSDTEAKDRTGYRSRKFYSYDPNQVPVGGGQLSTYGSIVFRAAEAMLNYMEAQYMKDGSLDGTSTTYWQKLRSRVNMDTDFNKTIAATDLTKENDWAVYSAGKMVDATLYNIRRERRNELMGEVFRWDDLKRWRALDQVQNYQIEGCNFWTSMYDSDKYKDENGNSLVVPRGQGDNPNLSNTEFGNYLRPYQIIQTNNLLFNGYNWTDAAYLNPLPIQEMIITANEPVGDEAVNLETSPVYQNPGWPSTANAAAVAVPGF